MKKGAHSVRFFCTSIFFTGSFKSRAAVGGVGAHPSCCYLRGRVRPGCTLQKQPFTFTPRKNLKTPDNLMNVILKLRGG